MCSFFNRNRKSFITLKLLIMRPMFIGTFFSYFDEFILSTLEVMDFFFYFSFRIVVTSSVTTLQNGNDLSKRKSYLTMKYRLFREADTSEGRGINRA